jgi:uncharacterized damage-inducible protein DinB
MQKDIFLDILSQNQMTTYAVFNKITVENVDFRLNEQTASAGFIYRHVGETMNRLGYFLGVPTEIQNTTMGHTDNGQGKNLDTSRLLVEQGFEMLQKYVENTPASAWLDLIETPFFGTVSRARLFSHILFHNTYHSGQISLTLVRGGIFQNN